MPEKVFKVLMFIMIPLFIHAQAPDTTYAERLGFPKGSRVLILHVDDAGMSFDSNEGAEMALTKGVSTSVSVMMPCSWVPGFVSFLKSHPEIDAGLHLTLTSEWNYYRWGPVTGRKNTPGLVDSGGYLWPSVEAVVKHASADEIEMEILRASSASEFSHSLDHKRRFDCQPMTRPQGERGRQAADPAADDGDLKLLRHHIFF